MSKATIPQFVKDGSITKWKKPLEIIEENGHDYHHCAELLEEWWNNLGQAQCGFCRLFRGHASDGEPDCYGCPLFDDGVSEVCHPAWDDIQNLVNDYANSSPEDVGRVLDGEFVRLFSGNAHWMLRDIEAAGVTVPSIAPTTTGGKELVSVGFTLLREVATGRELGPYHKGRWFEVVNPEGDEGVVLRQGAGCWHFFYKDFEGTASGSSAERCHQGGLGDAIETDGQMRGYKKAVIDAPSRLLAEYEGLYRSSSDCFNA